jgi:hypothetical protein
VGGFWLNLESFLEPKKVSETEGAAQKLSIEKVQVTVPACIQGVAAEKQGMNNHKGHDTFCRQQATRDSIPTR